MTEQPLDQLEWDALNEKLQTLPDGEERAAALAEYRHRDGISRNSFSRAMQWVALTLAVVIGLSRVPDVDSGLVGAFAVAFAVSAAAAFVEARRARHPAKYSARRTEQPTVTGDQVDNDAGGVSSSQAEELPAGPGTAVLETRAEREPTTTAQRETP